MRVRSFEQLAHVACPLLRLFKNIFGVCRHAERPHASFASELAAPRLDVPDAEWFAKGPAYAVENIHPPLSPAAPAACNAASSRGDDPKSLGAVICARRNKVLLSWNLLWMRPASGGIFGRLLTLRMVCRPSSGQQSMSRRPISEHRRKSEDRSSHGHLPRRSSSGALSGAGRLASEQASGREPESDQQHPAFHVRSDLQAVQSAPSMPHRVS